MSAVLLAQVADNSFRRVITANDENGRSRVLFDGPPRSFGALHECWMTDGTASDGKAAVDPVEREFSIAPAAGGSVFRLVEIPPESEVAHLSEEDRLERVRAAFASVNSRDALVDGGRHPAMHRTNTVDYITVLRGTVTMLLDEGEVELQPCDVVVQRGTTHAWINNGSEPALLAAVLIDAGSMAAS